MDLFLTATPKVWTESIGFPDSELYGKSFEENSLKKTTTTNIQEACQTLKIIGVAISSHIILFRFLPISGHCNWGKKFVSIILKGKIFRAYKKFLISLITGATISIALFW